MKRGSLRHPLGETFACGNPSKQKSSLVILGYVESSGNSADAPSRRGKKRKWENALYLKD